MTESTPPPPVSSVPWAARFGDPNLPVCLLLALFSILSLWSAARADVSRDYYHYWAAGRVVEGRETADLYGPEGQRVFSAHFGNAVQPSSSPRQDQAARQTVIDPLQTPLQYAVLGLLAGGDYDFDLAVFQFISIAAAAAALLVLARTAGHSWTFTLVASAILLTWFHPIVLDTKLGNVSRIQLGMIAGYLALHAGPRGVRRRIAAGALLGAFLLFKPTLALVFAPLLLSRVIHRRFMPLFYEAVGALGGGLLAVAFSSWYFGTPSCWISWQTNLLQVMSRADRTVEMGNWSLPRLLTEASGWSPGPILPVVAAALVCGAIGLRRRHEPGPVGDETAAEALTCVATGGAMLFLASPLVWQHYYILAIPALFVLTRPRLPEEGNRSALLRQAGAFAAFLLLTRSPLHVLYTPSTPVVAWMFGVATLLLFVLCLFSLRVNHKSQIPDPRSSPI